MSFRRGTFTFGARAITVGALIAILATTAGATALLANPGDSTSSGSPLHPAVDNTSRTADMVITSATNTSVVAAVMDLGAKSHGCEVTASAEVQRTVNTTGVYVFSIGLAGTTSTTSSERRIEFVATADADVVWVDAATNQGYDNLSGAQTFNFFVRKAASSYPDATITNASISVVCANAQL
jgi:hypothetical protein